MMAKKMQFSLRSLVVIVAFAALLFGWSSDHWRLRQRIDALENPPTLEHVITSGNLVAPIAPPPGARRVGQEADADSTRADISAGAVDRR